MNTHNYLSMNTHRYGESGGWKKNLFCPTGRFEGTVNSCEIRWRLWVSEVLMGLWAGS